MTTTTDLSNFSNQGLKDAAALLNAYADNDVPTNFSAQDVQLMYNTNSGNVFLTNEDYQVVMLNNGQLEELFSCPVCGYEGFKETVIDNDEHSSCECAEWIIETFGA